MPARVRKNYPPGAKFPHHEHRTEKGRDPAYFFKKTQAAILKEKKKRQEKYDLREVYEDSLPTQSDEQDGIG